MSPNPNPNPNPNPKPRLPGDRRRPRRNPRLPGGVRVLMVTTLAVLGEIPASQAVLGSLQLKILEHITRLTQCPVFPRQKHAKAELSVEVLTR